MILNARDGRLGKTHGTRFGQEPGIGPIGKLAPFIQSGIQSGILSVILIGALAGCVTENMDTGEMVPRGNQGMEFSKVEKYAEQLQDGMSKTECVLLLGQPAERDDSGDVWVYLPERYGILIPARALRLEFKDSILVDHGYRPIILGARL